MLRSILTKHGLNDQYLNRYSHTNNGGVKGHDGVTVGSKRSFSPKLLFFVQITWYGHVTHICSSARYPLQKLLVKKTTRGHLGSQGSKVNFDQNCYFYYRLHGMVMWLIYIHQLDTLYKSYRFKKLPGVIWGHRGQKLILTKIVISPTDYMVW